MSEKNGSQSQQKKNATWGAEGFIGMDAWRKAAEENLGRLTQWWDEVAKLQAAGFEQANRAIDESAKLAHESLQYAGQISSEWRKMTMDATRRTMDLVSSQG